MSVLSIREFFNHAPMFRGHEGIVGERYFQKDPHDPNAPGLWVVETPELLEIATQISAEYSSKSRNAARADYSFEKVNVQPGDAVIDYHLYFAGAREGYDTSGIAKLQPKGSASDMYAVERANGALIQFHIPKDAFKAKYDYDEGQRQWRKKPFPMRFTAEETFIQTEAGAEHIPKNCEVTLSETGTIKYSRPGVFTGAVERMICGQPIDFYLRELSDIKVGDSSLEMALSPKFTGLAHRNVKGQRQQNPIEGIRHKYEVAAQLFSKTRILTEDQSAELEAHLKDISARHTYFENMLER